jgi:hypothetical protein
MKSQIAHKQAYRSGAVNRIEKLIAVLADKEVMLRERIARGQHICKICGKPAVQFRTDCAKLEYRISSICQSCQDYYYLFD